MQASKEFSFSREERTSTVGVAGALNFRRGAAEFFVRKGRLKPKSLVGSLLVQMSKLKRDLKRQGLLLKFGHFEIKFRLIGRWVRLEICQCQSALILRYSIGSAKKNELVVPTLPLWVVSGA